MTWDEARIWFWVIVAADLFAAVLYAVVYHFIKKMWKRTGDNVKCEICGLPKKTLRRTKDKKIKACTTCKKIYNDSLDAPPEVISS